MDKEKKNVMRKEKKHYIDMEYVQFMMKKQNISLQAMADAIGVTPRTVKKYFDGADQRHMSAEMTFKFATALNAPFMHLFCKEPF